VGWDKHPAGLQARKFIQRVIAPHMSMEGWLCCPVLGGHWCAHLGPRMKQPGWMDRGMEWGSAVLSFGLPTH
jgi:hypothetical protein